MEPRLSSFLTNVTEQLGFDMESGVSSLLTETIDFVESVEVQDDRTCRKLEREGSPEVSSTFASLLENDSGHVSPLFQPFRTQESQQQALERQIAAKSLVRGLEVLENATLALEALAKKLGGDDFEAKKTTPCFSVQALKQAMAKEYEYDDSENSENTQSPWLQSTDVEPVSCRRLLQYLLDMMLADKIANAKAQKHYRQDMKAVRAKATIGFKERYKREAEAERTKVFDHTQEQYRQDLEAAEISIRSKASTLEAYLGRYMVAKGRISAQAQQQYKQDVHAADAKVLTNMRNSYYQEMKPEAAQIKVSVRERYVRDMNAADAKAFDRKLHRGKGKTRDPRRCVELTDHDLSLLNFLKHRFSMRKNAQGRKAKVGQQRCKLDLTELRNILKVLGNYLEKADSKVERANDL